MLCVFVFVSHARRNGDHHRHQHQHHHHNAPLLLRLLLLLLLRLLCSISAITLLHLIPSRHSAPSPSVRPNRTVEAKNAELLIVVYQSE